MKPDVPVGSRSALHAYAAFVSVVQIASASLVLVPACAVTPTVSGSPSTPATHPNELIRFTYARKIWHRKARLRLCEL